MAHKAIINFRVASTFPAGIGKRAPPNTPVSRRALCCFLPSCLWVRALCTHLAQPFCYWGDTGGKICSLMRRKRLPNAFGKGGCGQPSLYHMLCGAVPCAAPGAAWVCGERARQAHRGCGYVRDIWGQGQVIQKCPPAYPLVLWESHQMKDSKHKVCLPKLNLTFGKLMN